jgi:protein involved in polysaccharide export with SLBB domain
MNRHRLVAAICLLTAGSLVYTGGCNVAPKAKLASEAKPADPAILTLRPGDQLELKFYYAPELNETQKIRPDGKLSLQLVGEVQAAGKTTAELADELKQLYSKDLKYPQVTIVIREQLQQKVYVAGEVTQPGLVDLPGPMSVLDAVMASGGFNMTTAETSSVIVMRYEDGKRVGYKVDLRDAMKGGEHEPFALAPQDIVFVPRAAVVNINNFLDQYVRGMIPQTGFTFVHTSGNNAIGLDTGRD